MLIPDINSIHKIAPRLFIGGVSNRQLPPEEMLHFRVRGIGMPDKESLDHEKSLLSTTLNPKERQEKSRDIDHALMRKKVVSIHNYHVPLEGGGSREVTDFDDFVRVAPPELVAWLFDVVQYGEKLSAAEMRNFLPQPASPSGFQSGEAETSGAAASATPSAGSSATAAT